MRLKLLVNAAGCVLVISAMLIFIPISRNHIEIVVVFSLIGTAIGWAIAEVLARKRLTQ